MVQRTSQVAPDQHPVQQLEPLLPADSEIDHTGGAESANHSSSSSSKSLARSSSLSSVGDRSRKHDPSDTDVVGRLAASASRHESIGLDSSQRIRLMMVANVTNDTPPRPAPAWLAPQAGSGAGAGAVTNKVIFGLCELRVEGGARAMRRLLAASLLTRRYQRA